MPKRKLDKLFYFWDRDTPRKYEQFGNGHSMNINFERKVARTPITFEKKSHVAINIVIKRYMNKKQSNHIVSKDFFFWEFDILKVGWWFQRWTREKLHGNELFKCVWVDNIVYLWEFRIACSVPRIKLNKFLKSFMKKIKARKENFMNLELFFGHEIY